MFSWADKILNKKNYVRDVAKYVTNINKNEGKRIFSTVTRSTSMSATCCAATETRGTATAS